MERLDSLTQAVDRVAGVERHLRLQTDALRHEMGQQRDSWKSRAEAAERALTGERTQNDAMRRLLGNRGALLPDAQSASGSALPGTRLGGQ